MSKKLSITYHHLLYFSLVCFGALILRLLIFGRFGYLFLVWNLFLAWIPFHIAVFAAKIVGETKRKRQNGSQPVPPSGKSYLFIILLLLGWLAFFPNAPYLVTDFVHLRFSALHTPFTFWFHAALFFFFSIGGLLYAVCSLQLVEKILDQMWGKTLRFITLIIIFLLTGFGIYIGRFLRWNSWDLLFNPITLWRDLVENLNASGLEYPLLITLVYATITGFSYFFFRLAVRFQAGSSSKISRPPVPTSGHSQT